MSSRQVGVPGVPGQEPPVWEIQPSIAAFPGQAHVGDDELSLPEVLRAGKGGQFMVEASSQ